MDGIKIYSFEVGNTSIDQSLVTYRAGMGVKNKSVFGCYFIQADGKKIMVDTGPAASQEHAAKWHKEVDPEIGPEQNSVMRLKKLNVKPEEIDIILITHLHWDHAYHLEKFPNARIFVSKAELAFALNPLPPFFFSYENWQTGLTPFFIPSVPRMVQIEMVPTKITERLSMIPTPGHTPGHMAAVLQTAKGPYVFAGDAILGRENFVAVPERHLPFRMIGLYMDFEAGWKSMGTILNVVGGDANRVLPAHDETMLGRRIYPD